VGANPQVAADTLKTTAPLLPLKSGSTAGNKDATGGNLTISVYQSANFSSERYHRG
jgi:hypothetical protein